MSKFLPQWAEITRDKFIIDIIKGFRIPFVELPTQLSELPTHKMNEEEESALDMAIVKLRQSGAIFKAEVETGQYISPIFGVPKQDGSVRLVINLKRLNEYVECPHFKMEDYRSALTLISKNYFLAVIDLRDAYHSIPINPEHQKYLKFRWKDNMFKFTCLPFGLNIAPYIYTKVMRPVLAHLREQGVLSVSFLDDCLIIGSDYKNCKQSLDKTLKIYERLGLVVNLQKSQLKPSKRVQFLGFIFDTERCQLSLPETKKMKIRQRCSRLLQLDICVAQELAEVIGLLVAACPAVQYGCVYTKQLEYEKVMALRGTQDYKIKVCLSNEAKHDLEWWRNNIMQAFNPISRDGYDLVITTDSSLRGWGAESGGIEAKGSWTNAQKQCHINELELLAVKLALMAFLREKKNVRVLIRCDNTTAVSYVNNFGGCRSPKCHQIAKSIWQYCEQQKSTVFASYINTKDNVIADRLSRDEQDSSDFMLLKEHFQSVCARFGKPTIDLFASYLTAQCPKYYSWMPDPGSSGVDAFTHKWEDGFYAFPPFCLVGRVLRKVREDNVTGIVVAPKWTAQTWYPLFVDMCVSDIMFFSHERLFWCPYTNRNHQLPGRMQLMAAIISNKQ